MRGLDDRLREFEFVEDALSDAVTVADNTTGPDGMVMTLNDRIRDKLKRHGAESPNPRANPERDDYIRAAARRVADRLAAVGQRDPALEQSASSAATIVSARATPRWPCWWRHFCPKAPPQLEIWCPTVGKR